MRYLLSITLVTILSCNNNEESSNTVAQPNDTTSSAAVAQDTTNQNTEKDLEEVIDVLKTVKP